MDELLVAVNPDPESSSPSPSGAARDAATPATSPAPAAPEPTTSEVRAWARAQGFTVPDRGRLRPDVWQAWRDAQQQ